MGGCHELLVYVSKHQFSIEDPGRTESHDLWQNAWDVDHVGVDSGQITIFTSRSGGLVPLTIEFRPSAPTVDHGVWSSVVDASLLCTTGTLQVRDPLDREPAASLALAPGSYRALVLMGDVDSVEYDGSEGADHYRLVLWPGEARPVHAHTRYEAVRYPRMEPRLPLPRALELAKSVDRHHRYCAMTELARHGVDVAFDALAAAAVSEIDRFQAVASLTLSRPFRTDRIEPYLDDASSLVRRAVVRVLGHALFDFEFDRLPWFDSDSAYRIVQRAAADPETAEAAASVAAKLDLLAEDIRAATPGYIADSADGPLLAAARAVIAELVARELLEVEPRHDLERSADALSDVMGPAADFDADIAPMVAEVLLDQPGVEELYADDAAVRDVVRRQIEAAVQS